MEENVHRLAFSFNRLNVRMDKLSNIKSVRFSRLFTKVDYGYLAIVNDLSDRTIPTGIINVDFENNIDDNGILDKFGILLSKSFGEFNANNREYKVKRVVKSIKKDDTSIHCRCITLVKGYDKEEEEDVTEAILNFTFSLPFTDLDVIKNIAKGA